MIDAKCWRTGVARGRKDGGQQGRVGPQLTGCDQGWTIVCRHRHKETGSFGRTRAAWREVLRKMDAIGPNSAGQVEIAADDQPNMRGAAARGEGKGEVSPLSHVVVAQEHAVAGAKLRDCPQWIGQTLFVGDQN